MRDGRNSPQRVVPSRRIDTYIGTAHNEGTKPLHTELHRASNVKPTSPSVSEMSTTEGDDGLTLNARRSSASDGFVPSLVAVPMSSLVSLGPFAQGGLSTPHSSCSLYISPAYDASIHHTRMARK